MAIDDRDLYVVPDDDRRGWFVVRGDQKRSDAHFASLPQAIGLATEMVVAAGGETAEVRVTPARNGYHVVKLTAQQAVDVARRTEAIEDLCQCRVNFHPFSPFES